MTAAELDELEWLHALWANPDRSLDPARLGEVMHALPALIAKVRAAEALAVACDRVRLDYDGRDLAYIKGGDEMERAADAYRKAGAP